MFRLAPEKAHHLTLLLLRAVIAVPLLSEAFRSFFSIKNKKLHRQVFGLTFENPVGLAAGFDKNGKHLHEMSALGFGFIELGTVTPRPQSGNPSPRLFRLPSDEALINRMGFNNDGVEALVAQLKKSRPNGVIIGGNIGKNKDTPNENALDDYVICFEALFDYVDYFVVNVSSPNTPNLRVLQEKEPLTALLSHLQTLNQKRDAPKPLLLKIAPDLTDSQLDDIVEVAHATRLDGIIATNTTIARCGLNTDESDLAAIGMGGLSGAPLRSRATEVIRYLSQKLDKKIVIIGVGGIGSAADALEKIAAGAALVQIYSGLVYAGPALVKKINCELCRK